MSFPLSYARVGKICRQAAAASFKPEDKEDTKAVSFQSHGMPKMLRASAGLEKEVVFAGMMNRVEVWDKERFAAEELEEEEVSLDSIMDELGIPL